MFDTKEILTALGGDYVNSKLLEGVEDEKALAKRFIDTKTAYDKKQEGVIQKLTADATDVEKAEHVLMLRKELGTVTGEVPPESIDVYDFSGSAVERTDEQIAVIKQAYLDENIPAPVVARLMEKLDKFNVAQTKTNADAAEQIYTDAVSAYKDAHPGDKATTGPRIALKAMLQFAPPELRTKIKESGVLKNPSDLSALRKLGIGPEQLNMWEPIAEAMQSDKAITSEGEPAPITTGVKPQPGTKEAAIASSYDHHTSVDDRKKRGKDY